MGGRPSKGHPLVKQEEGSDSVPGIERDADLLPGYHSWDDFDVKMRKRRNVIRKSGSIRETILRIFNAYTDHPCYGVRLRGDDGRYLSAFTWYSYKEVFTRIQDFGSGLLQLVDSRSVVGTCSINSLEWYIADYALLYYSFIGAPLYATFDVSQLSDVVTKTKMKAMICSRSAYTKILAVASTCPTLKYIILMEPTTKSDDEAVISPSPDKGPTILTFQEVEAAGKLDRKRGVLTPPDDVLTLIHTSGSTGMPKGAIFTEQSVLGIFQRLRKATTRRINYTFKISSRKNDFIVLAYGGRIGIYTGDIRNMFEDLAILRPFSLSGTPEIWNKIHSEFDQRLNLLLVDVDPLSSEAMELRTQLLQSFSQVLGDRICHITSGGAPTSPAVLEFIEECWGVVPSNSYGATELGGICHGGSVGSRIIDVRLRDWEEYSSTDKPYPRGELLLKSKEMFMGYFGDEEKTKSAMDDGFYCTGDIVRITGNKGYREGVEVIDRKKNIFKLSQGAYVAPGRLETFFIESHAISQIYIYGDSLRSFLVAVVVPVAGFLSILESRLSELSGLSEAEIAASPLTQSYFLSELSRISRHQSLQPYEVPRFVFVSLESFTTQKDLLTDSLKPNRRGLRRYFQSDIDRLYSDEFAREASEATPELVALQKLRKIVADVLGDDEGDRLDSSFVQMGGSSLDAVKLTQLIRDNFDSDMTLSKLYEASSLSDIASQLPEPKNIRAKEYTQFMNDSVLPSDLSINSDATTVCSPSPTPSVLLTGATGFTGIVVLHQLLLSEEFETIYCLVRSASEESCLTRIRVAMEAANRTWESSFEARLEMLAGDVSQPLLSLPPSRYAAVASTVSSVVHVAASVNTVLPYYELRKANVVGTLNVIEFCLSGNMKTLHHISTTSVVPTTHNGTETRVPVPPSPEKAPSSGYNLSKLAAELLVYEASERGLPCIIFRPGMIGFCTETGFANLTDKYSRLLLGELSLGIVPQVPNGSHWDMTPVNYFARCIVEVMVRGVGISQNRSRNRSPSPSLSEEAKGKLPLSPFSRTVAVSDTLSILHFRNPKGSPTLSAIHKAVLSSPRSVHPLKVADGDAATTPSITPSTTSPSLPAFKEVSWAEWKVAMGKLDPQNPLYPLRASYSRSTFPQSKQTLSQTHREALFEGSPLSQPPIIGAKHLEAWVQYLAHSSAFHT